MLTNPLDKATMISIVPFDVPMVFPTITPGKFLIPAAADDDFNILVLGPSFWYQDMGEDRPAIRVAESSIQVATSFVNDFCNSQLGMSEDAKPGLMFVPGAKTKHEIRGDKGLAKDLLDLDTKQKKWFKSLVEIADILWINTNGQPAAISATARLAAQKLNLNHKEWLKDTHTVDLVRCPACGTLKDPQFPVCTACHTIVDPVKYGQMGLVSMSEKSQVSNTLQQLVK